MTKVTAKTLTDEMIREYRATLGMTGADFHIERSRCDQALSTAGGWGLTQDMKRRSRAAIVKAINARRAAEGK